MEESKYYKPQIEEFHVGFEFEYNASRWMECELSVAHDIASLSKENREQRIRVKHLDQEDIESLGWELFRSNSNENHRLKWFKHTLKDFTLQLNTYEDGVVVVRVFDPMHNFFSGYVKNKSELKRIMKMIGIE